MGEGGRGRAGGGGRMRGGVETLVLGVFDCPILLLEDWEQGYQDLNEDAKYRIPARRGNF
jgi:hypothetical protein